MSAVMWISMSPVQMRTSVVRSAQWGTQVGVTSSPVAALSHGNCAPSKPLARAFARAASRRR